MAHDVTLPVLGESVSEGTVSRWLKKVGEPVAVDEPLVEISTDKVDTEIPAPASGVLLEIRVHEDETATVGDVLAVIGEPAAEPDAVPPAADAAPASPVPEPPAPEPPAPVDLTWLSVPAEPPAVVPPAVPAPVVPAPVSPPPAPVTDLPGLGITPSPKVPEVAPHQIAPTVGTAPYVTPLVRKLADEYGVDLDTVHGSGVGGRIRKQDILDAAGPGVEAPAAAPEPAPAPVVPEPVVPEPVPAAPEPMPVPVVTLPAAVVPMPEPEVPAPVPVVPVVVPEPVVPAPQPAPAPTAPVAVYEVPAKPAAVPVAGTTEKISRLRATIARRMVESLQVSAQLTATVEVDLTPISRLRARTKDEFRAREGVGLTYLAFIAKATTEALKEYPKLNATIDTEAGLITYPDGEHLGIAVDTPRGLLVPVIKNAGDLSVSGLAKKIADLGARTRNNQVTPDELGGGTFTITNYGSTGTLLDTPIINQPQVAILGTGVLTRRPVVVADPRLGEIIAVRDMMYLSLSYDHRLVDGADASRFLGAIKTRLEGGDFGAEF